MLAEIKVHLQRLGYNAIAGAEAEKENGLFDEKLEAAVRVYQSSFNLPVTGFLDTPTIQSLSLPRTSGAATESISSTICSHIRSAIAATFDSLATVVPLSFREVESLEEAMIKIQFDGDSDGDEWVFEFFEGEHGDEDAKMKIDFLRRFLAEDDAAATLYGNPPPGLGPPPPLLPKSCSHSA
ncbi:hypothetical protein SUGI_0933300 [Cryptomeria japonica]|nr:hypothetical protein SUGI_0933300 [Cryptomeria japonica]